MLRVGGMWLPVAQGRAGRQQLRRAR